MPGQWSTYSTIRFHEYTPPRPPAQRINFHDSMGGSGLSTTSALMKWLEDEDDDKNGDNGTFNVDEWTVAPPDKNTPQQV